ncbi:hypothetical protein [Nocardia sp. NPDC058666]|uniref:hypothetical protein n=1 Tax=Nocardia sp. NPDC058666 TaxID=3346587 RepID=UPI00366A35ED
MQALAAAGEQVVAVSRGATEFALPDGVRHQRADLTAADTLADAFVGATALFLHDGVPVVIARKTTTMAGPAGLLANRLCPDSHSVASVRWHDTRSRVEHQVGWGADIEDRQPSGRPTG